MSDASSSIPPRGWVWLGVFWAVILLALGGGALTLAALGPLPEAPVALAEAPVEAPPPTPLPPRGVPENLARHVDPALVEFTAAGALPRIGEDGRMPMRVYARPFDRQDPRPVSYTHLTLPTKRIV